MNRAALRSRVRDLLVEQGTELYSDAYIDSWVDQSYTYYCNLAAELDRSYYMAETPGITYPANTNYINIAGIVGDGTGAATPALPFRIVGVDDETNGTDPISVTEVIHGELEDRLEGDFSYWTYVGHMRFGIRRRPANARTLRLYWQDVPQSLSAVSAKCVIQVPAFANIVNDETFVLTDTAAANTTFRFQVNGAAIGAGTAVPVRTGMGTSEVAAAVKAAVDGIAAYNATHVQGTDLVVVEQNTAGVLGNRVSSETVANAGFTISSFFGGRAADNAISGIPEQFHILLAYDTALSIIEQEEGFIMYLKGRRDDWQQRFVSFMQLRQTASPRRLSGGGTTFGG